MGKLEDNVFLKRLLYLTIILTVLSQPVGFDRYIRPLMYIGWILLAFSLFFTKKGVLPNTGFLKIFVINYFLYILFCLITTAFGINHLSSQYLRIMFIPILMTIIGNFFQGILTDKDVYSLSVIYVLSSLVYAVYVNVTDFSSYQNWLNSNVYVFTNKNSAAQIWFIAIFVTWFIIIPQTKGKKNLFWLATIVYIVIISSMSQCRSALLGICCVIVYDVLINSKHKLLWLLLIAVGIVLLFHFPVSREFINQTLLLDKYVDADLNKISSGRIQNWANALSIFNKNEQNFFLGTGNYYVDCSYISVLTESGLVGFLLIEPIWILRIVKNFKHRYMTFARENFYSSMTVFYIVVSLLEAYPPFGPGVSSFMFWLLCAYGDVSCSEG